MYTLYKLFQPLTSRVAWVFVSVACLSNSEPLASNVSFGDAFLKFRPQVNKIPVVTSQYLRVLFAETC